MCLYSVCTMRLLRHKDHTDFRTGAAGGYTAPGETDVDLKVVHIGPKCDKSGSFSDRISVDFSRYESGSFTDQISVHFEAVVKSDVKKSQICPILGPI